MNVIDQKRQETIGQLLQTLPVAFNKQLAAIQLIMNSVNSKCEDVLLEKSSNDAEGDGGSS